MTIGNLLRQTSVVWIAAAALLAAPSAARAHGRAVNNSGLSGILQDPQQGRDTNQEEARLEQEQEKRDSEKEARDRAQEQIARLKELYDEGRENMDEYR